VIGVFRRGVNPHGFGDLAGRHGRRAVLSVFTAVPAFKSLLSRKFVLRIRWSSARKPFRIGAVNRFLPPRLVLRGVVLPGDAGSRAWGQAV